MTTTLAQLLAVERGIKQHDNSVSSELYKQLQRSAAFSGETRTYRSLTENGVQQPDARTQVVADAADLLRTFSETRTRTIDTTLTKDVSNRDASADLKVGDVVIATGVPSVTLLALEKHADDIVAFIQALPVLDPTEKWEYDASAGFHRSEPSKTLKTSKETIPLVLWEPSDPATSKHPAQVDKVVSDVPVGEWTITRFSSALTADRKRQLLGRAMAFREAVKSAREEANRAPVTDTRAGKTLFDWLLAE